MSFTGSVPNQTPANPAENEPQQKPVVQIYFLAVQDYVDQFNEQLNNLCENIMQENNGLIKIETIKIYDIIPTNIKYINGQDFPLKGEYFPHNMIIYTYWESEEALEKGQKEGQFKRFLQNWPDKYRLTVRGCITNQSEKESQNNSLSNQKQTKNKKITLWKILYSIYKNLKNVRLSTNQIMIIIWLAGVIAFFIILTLR